MSMKHCWCATAILASYLSSATSPRSSAKPPDLPLEQGVACPEGRIQLETSELFGSLRRAVESLRAEMGAAPPDAETPLTLDTIVPALLPLLLGASPRQEMPARTPARLAEAEQKFQRGERYRRQGDLGQARICYEEAHLLSPTSRYGRLAMQRLLEMEQVSAEIEESPVQAAPTTVEPPVQQRDFDNPGGETPEESFGKLRLKTQPLGLVEPAY
jgi:hypothetical protein